MPTYNYTCPRCGHEDRNILVSRQAIRDHEDTRLCKGCGNAMDREFPKKTHTIVESSVDGRDVGRVVQQKNEALKSREAGYSHETKALRRDVERKTQKIMENRQ